MRGDVYALRRARNAVGREQQGQRYCVLVQADWLPLSTELVVPTSTSATPTVFRPAIEVDGGATLALCEQLTGIDPQRLGPHVGYLGLDELRRVNEALRLVLDL